jgi:hypothetical protein
MGTGRVFKREVADHHFNESAITGVVKEVRSSGGGCYQIMIGRRVHNLVETGPCRNDLCLIQHRALLPLLANRGLRSPNKVRGKRMMSYHVDMEALLIISPGYWI